MSPREQHVSPGAKPTTVRLTLEDHEAVHEIAKARAVNNNDRTRLNDILVDALWELLERTTGKTKGDVQASMPKSPSPSKPKNNVTPMSGSKKR